jgi:hypothetical protein
MTYEASLPPSYLQFLSESRGAKYFEYYTGPFEHFENTLLEKHDVTSDVVALKSIVKKHDDGLIEIGAGTGRVTKELVGFCSSLIALEKSADSFVKLQNQFSANPDVKILNQDFFEYKRPGRQKIGSVVLSSLSINLFLEATVDNLLENCDRMLTKDGNFYFGCLDASSLIDFEKYNGKVGSSTSLEEYRDEDLQVRAMLSNTMYVADEQYLIQNWFVDMCGSKSYPQFCFSAMVEKLWTVETLQPYLENWGFVIEQVAEFKINGGGGDGLAAKMCRCVKE